ncbi:histidinol-phosphate transaminase [Coprococcus comes]|uniref:histidinol-phosphate transaminase n=1 Tax=Coprococcus comes TaxID=410072 RepID=UPI001898EA6D|nr:histidinol-phosphate transaminase [Coprococcus comes]
MREFEKNIRKVEPYVPGEQPQKKVIKLNTNENPYPPAPGVLAAMKKLEGHVDSLRLYPDPTSDALVSALADFYHVGKDQVFVGVGSDDVLSMCFLTFFNSEKPVFFPDITYSFYKVWADLYRIPYECKKVDENFHIIKEDYYPENGGVIFPNPNAPTSIYEDLEFVEDIIRHNQDVIVIVDEAYIDFAGESALSLLDKYDNLIITQTFSKARSMAGMRIGYAIASPLLIKYLNDAKYSFNSYTMNKTSLVYGAEAVKDKEYFAETTRKIVETRDWAEEEFKKLGFAFPKPSANFIFVSHPEYDAKELFEAMKAKGIYVRFWGSERIEQYLRVTIGTREEMEALFAFLREYVM